MLKFANSIALIKKLQINAIQIILWLDLPPHGYVQLVAPIGNPLRVEWYLKVSSSIQTLFYHNLNEHRAREKK